MNGESDMNTTRTLFLAVLAVSFCAGADWRQFRGNQGTGYSDARNVPTRFTAEQAAWKAPLVGRAAASPIVVGDKVLVTASNGRGETRLHLTAYDAATGRQLWHRQLWATGHTLSSSFAAVADPTPASDGRHVLAFFSSNDLACFDLDGNLLWFRGLAYETPATRNDVGMASSPIISGDTAVVQMENQGESYAVGLELATGKTRWRVDRPHTATWTTPIATEDEAGSPIVLLQAKTGLTALEPASGRKLWEHEAPCSTMSTAAATKGNVYLPVAGMELLRTQPGAFQPAWQQGKLRASNASPMIAGDRLYVVKGPAILVCADAATGEQRWQLRLKGPMWATPAIAGDHLYAVSYDGLVQVVRLGDKEGKVVSTCQIDSKILASPALADGAVYFRSDAHLWKFGGNQQP
jgi:outer membrane protein assembly factor BamB